MKIVGERRRRGENGGGEGKGGKPVLGRILIERPHFHFPPLVFLAPGMFAWKRSLRRKEGERKKTEGTIFFPQAIEEEEKCAKVLKVSPLGSRREFSRGTREEAKSWGQV